MRRVLCELRGAALEEVGEDQTERLRQALTDAVKALSAWLECVAFYRVPFVLADIPAKGGLDPR